MLCFCLFPFLLGLCCACVQSCSLSCRCWAAWLSPVLPSGQAAQEPAPPRWYFVFLLLGTIKCLPGNSAWLLAWALHPVRHAWLWHRQAHRQRVLSASPAGAMQRGQDSAACWSPAALGRASRAAVNTLPGALQCRMLAKQQFRAPWDLSVVITTTSSHLCSLRPHLASQMGPAAQAATLILPSLQTGLLGLVPASPRPAWAWRARQGRDWALRAAAQPLPQLLAREQTAALQPLPSLRAGRLPLSLTNMPTK